MKIKILIAPNAFKHSLSAIEVAGVIKSLLDSLDLNLCTELAPIADGGDGTIDVIKHYFKKAKYINCYVFNPLMKKIKSQWLLLDRDTAVIELAKASGLALLKGSKLDPLKANTYGTGQLVLSALNKGCKKIILSLGGSATIDAGLGILCALGAKIYDKNKKILKPYTRNLLLVEDIDSSKLDKQIRKAKFYVLCDVQSTLTGKNGTSMYALQKGADKKSRALIEKSLVHFSKIIKRKYKKDFLNEPMLGSAGGVAYSLKALLNAKIYPGFTYISKLVSLEGKIKKSDLVITGEGSLWNCKNRKAT